uniref:SHSP domain-containing protein n=1 Tax=Globodera rostochiensis TaxID=31243 RepID=A0A914HRJ2_GLORO
MEIFFPHLLWTSILDSCLVALIIWLCNFKRGKSAKIVTIAFALAFMNSMVVSKPKFLQLLILIFGFSRWPP